jgi:transcriptional regulator with XRE-family HTH domain
MLEGTKKHKIDELDKAMIIRIASRAKELRIQMGFTYEEFALHASINRNTYFKFEKSAITADNFTAAIMVKVIRGLNQTLESFFKDL